MEMMPAQQEIFPEFSQTKALPKRETPPVGEPAPAPVWLQRLSLVVLVIFCFFIGGLLALMPWGWGRYWTQNGWLMSHPALDLFLQRGWVRGLVSGVGVLDMWIGVSEMMHYRDYRA